MRTVWVKVILMLSGGVFLLGTACRSGQQEKKAKTVEASGPMLYTGRNLDRYQVLETISLGSCNRQDLPQEMWPFILENDPDLWIWLGDNIYGDTRDMDVLKAKYTRRKLV